MRTISTILFTLFVCHGLAAVASTGSSDSTTKMIGLPNPFSTPISPQPTIIPGVPTPIKPNSPSAPSIIGNPTVSANPSQICLARIIEQGLFKLPQLVAKKIGFTTFQSQVVAGILYIINYSAPNFKAVIKGTCFMGKATLTQTSYQAL